MSKGKDLREERCEHVATGQFRFAAGLKHKQTGRKHLLCQPCLISFLQEQGADPAKIVIGYNVYQSIDPELPKDRWRKVNDTPLANPEFTQDTRDMKPGTYYTYVTAVSALGVESSPSKVASVTIPMAEKKGKK